MKSITGFLFSLLIASIITGCGGGGSSAPIMSTTGTVTGTVTLPVNTNAKLFEAPLPFYVRMFAGPVHAAVISDLTTLIVKVGSATTHPNASGVYTLTVESGTNLELTVLSPSGSIVLQAIIPSVTAGASTSQNVDTTTTAIALIYKGNNLTISQIESSSAVANVKTAIEAALTGSNAGSITHDNSVINAVSSAVSAIVGGPTIVIPTNIPGLEGGCAGTLLNLDPPPYVYEVKITPEAPKAGEEVTVNAAIANDSEKTDAVTTLAWLYYSVDGGKNFSSTEMVETGNKDANGHKIWSTKIPGQDVGKDVIYYVSARDDIGNFSTETAGASLDGTLPPTAEKGPVFNVPVPDEECKDAEGALDILGVSIGYDDKRLYGAIKTRDNFDKGTLSPAKINMLYIGFLNPDKGEDLTKGVGLYWAPLAKEAGGSTSGISTDCFAIDSRIQQTNQIVSDSESGASCVTDGNTLYFKINKSLFGSNPSGILRFVALSMQTNIFDLSTFTTSPPIPQDATAHVYVYQRTHTYKVQ